jgi:hypothetical protein
MHFGIFFPAHREGAKCRKLAEIQCEMMQFCWGTQNPLFERCRNAEWLKVNSEVCGNMIQENIGISPVLNTICMVKTSAVPCYVAHPECRECCVISVISQLWYHSSMLSSSARTAQAGVGFGCKDPINRIRPNKVRKKIRKVDVHQIRGADRPRPRRHTFNLPKKIYDGLPTRQKFSSGSWESNAMVPGSCWRFKKCKNYQPAVTMQGPGGGESPPAYLSSSLDGDGSTMEIIRLRLETNLEGAACRAVAVLRGCEFSPPYSFPIHPLPLQCCLSASPLATRTHVQLWMIIAR